MYKIKCLAICLLPLLFIIASCSNNNTVGVKQPANKIQLYYLSYNKYQSYDTIPIDSLKLLDSVKNDSLLYSTGFVFNNQNHIISLYTNDYVAPTDGGELNYQLDKLGIIYLKSTTWPNYYRLKSNNDSINNLIEVAIDLILLRDKLHCYGGITPTLLTTPKFVPPATE